MQNYLSPLYKIDYFSNRMSQIRQPRMDRELTTSESQAFNLPQSSSTCQLPGPLP